MYDNLKVITNTVCKMAVSLSSSFHLATNVFDLSLEILDFSCKGNVQC